MKKRLLVTLLAVGLIASVFSGCSSSSTSSAAPSASNSSSTSSSDAVSQTASSDGAVELVLWHNRGGNAGEALEQNLIPAFNSSQDKIALTPVYQGNESIAKLKALLQSNDTVNLPDVIQVYAGDIEYMSTVKPVVKMQDMIAKDSSFNLDDIMSILQYTYTYGGTLYSMPFHASTLEMYYNKTAFKEAGLDPEAPPATLAEMAEMAPKLLKKDGDKVTQYAITMGIQNNYLNHFIAMQGDYSFIGNNESGRTGRMTKAEFDENGTMKNFLTEWKKVLDTGAVQTVDEGSQAKDEFGAGISAMLFTSNTSLEGLKKTAEGKFELGVAPLPKVNASDKGGVCPGGSSIYIMDKGDQGKIDASWEFIKYWVSPENQSAWSQATGCIPVNQKSMELDDMKAYIEKSPEFMIAYNSLLNSDKHVQEHLAPTQQEFASIFKEVGQQFSDGQLTVDEAVQAMADQCNQALDEYNQANPIV